MNIANFIFGSFVQGHNILICLSIVSIKGTEDILQNINKLDNLLKVSFFQIERRDKQMDADELEFLGLNSSSTQSRETDVKSSATSEYPPSSLESTPNQAR